jgi:mRNA-degrading endonuclease toxin of MazEF toxin-antitoxin module
VSTAGTGTAQETGLAFFRPFLPLFGTIFFGLLSVGASLATLPFWVTGSAAATSPSGSSSRRSRWRRSWPGRSPAGSPTAAATSNVGRVFPFQVLLPEGVTGLRVDSKAQAEQVRSIAVDRLGPALGRVPAELMDRIDAALRLHLGL